jgi:hypothetical protein
MVRTASQIEKRKELPQDCVELLAIDDKGEIAGRVAYSVLRGRFFGHDWIASRDGACVALAQALRKEGRSRGSESVMFNAKPESPVLKLVKKGRAKIVDYMLEIKT